MPTDEGRPKTLSEQSSVDLIAACLALPIVERQIADATKRAFGGFSTMSPEKGERLEKQLAPWRERRQNLLAIVRGK